MKFRIPLSLLVSACLAVSAAMAWAQRALPTLTEADMARLKQALPATATAKPAQPRRLLIYNFTRGTYHDEAIAWATRALELMGEKTGAFTTTTSMDADVFTPERLRAFDAVVMNNTMLNVFGPPELEEARMRVLVDFVQGGKGIVGIHSASVWEEIRASTFMRRNARPAARPRHSSASRPTCPPITSGQVW
jgi:hypothetical protein